MLRADGAVYRACLQFAVLRWAIDALGLSLSEAASLPATVALGVVAVAGTAGRCVTLAQAHRLQPVCLVLNLSFNAATFSDSRSAVLPTLVPVPVKVLIGAIGGLLMVSINALLQHPGQLMVTAGRSIAMQNLTKKGEIFDDARNLRRVALAGCGHRAADGLAAAGRQFGGAADLAGAACSGLSRRYRRAPDQDCPPEPLRGDGLGWAGIR